jgi:hypothetical protein
MSSQISPWLLRSHRHTSSMSLSNQSLLDLSTHSSPQSSVNNTVKAQFSSKLLTLKKAEEITSQLKREISSNLKVEHLKDLAILKLDNQLIGVRISTYHGKASMGNMNIKIPSYNTIKVGERLNLLKDKIPIFTYIFGHNFCDEAHEDKNIITANCAAGVYESFQFSFEEYHNYMDTLEEFINKDYHLNHKFYLCLSLVVGLARAYLVGVRNLDLETVKILNLDEETGESLYLYKEKRKLLYQSNYLPIFTDFSKAKFETSTDNYSSDSDDEIINNSKSSQSSPRRYRTLQKSTKNLLHYVRKALYQHAWMKDFLERMLPDLNNLLVSEKNNNFETLMSSIQSII